MRLLDPLAGPDQPGSAPRGQRDDSGRYSSMAAFLPFGTHRAGMGSTPSRVQSPPQGGHYHLTVLGERRRDGQPRVGRKRDERRIDQRRDGLGGPRCASGAHTPSRQVARGAAAGAVASVHATVRAASTFKRALSLPVFVYIFFLEPDRSHITTTYVQSLNC